MGLKSGAILCSGNWKIIKRYRMQPFSPPKIVISHFRRPHRAAWHKKLKTKKIPGVF